MLVSANAASNARTANYDAIGSDCSVHAKVCHKDYLTLHPNQPDILIHDVPKVGDLTRWFPKQYRAEAMLVGTKG